VAQHITVAKEGLGGIRREVRNLLSESSMVHTFRLSQEVVKGVSGCMAVDGGAVVNGRACRIERGAVKVERAGITNASRQLAGKSECSGRLRRAFRKSM
jgi:hypothetical protein